MPDAFWTGFMTIESKGPAPCDRGDDWRRDPKFSTGPRPSRFLVKGIWQDAHHGVGHGVVEERGYYNTSAYYADLEGVHGLELEETVRGPRFKKEKAYPVPPNSIYHAPSNPKRKYRSLDPQSKYVHGTRARYVDGCRCEVCTMANRLYIRMYRRQKAAKNL